MGSVRGRHLCGRRRLWAGWHASALCHAGPAVTVACTLNARLPVGARLGHGRGRRLPWSRWPRTGSSLPRRCRRCASTGTGRSWRRGTGRPPWLHTLPRTAFWPLVIDLEREHHAVRQVAEALAAQLICALRGGPVGCGDRICRCSRTARRAPACDRRVRRGSGRGDVGRPSDDRRAAAGRADARRLLRRRPARRCAGRAPSPAAATPDWTGRRQGLL